MIRVHTDDLNQCQLQSPVFGAPGDNNAFVQDLTRGAAIPLRCQERTLLYCGQLFLE